MERLTPLATAFLDAEDVDPRASLAIGSLAVFEGPAPPFEEFVELIAGRLVLIPRYRQKLRTVPLGLAAPAWVDDPDFDIRWHIRNTALPQPGGPQEIGRLMSRVMSRRMNRDRPLWEYWFCEGLPDGRWALLSKLHHSLVDGVSGTDLYQLVLDPDPDAATARARHLGARARALDPVRHGAGGLGAGDLAGAGRARGGRLARRPASPGPPHRRDGAGAAVHVVRVAPGPEHVVDGSARGQPSVHVDGHLAGRRTHRAGERTA